MQAFGLARLGKDAELRHTANGEPVVNMALAFTFGPKGHDGKRATQWVEATFWGKRAEALAPYLLKGGLVSVTVEDVHIATYEGHNGPGHKLVGKVSQIDLAGSPQQQAAPTPAAKPAPRPAQKPAAQDVPFDEIPF